MPDELSFYLIPKKRTRAIEQMTPVATLKELINPRPDQEAHIADADGTLADITTKFNTLLSKLESRRILRGS